MGERWIRFCLFKELSSSESGGGISINGGPETIHVKFCVFIECMAPIGGGITIVNAQADFDCLCFESCHAENIQAIFYSGISSKTSHFTLMSQTKCCSFPFESTDSQGLTSYFHYTNGLMKDNNCTFNSVKHIAAHENDECESFEYNYCNLYNNTALTNGVLLQFNRTPLNKLTYINAIQNYCPDVYPLVRIVLSGDKTTFYYSNFINNTAISIFSQNCTIISSYVSNLSPIGQPDIIDSLSSQQIIDFSINQCIFRNTRLKKSLSIKIFSVLPIIIQTEEKE